VKCKPHSRNYIDFQAEPIPGSLWKRSSNVVLKDYNLLKIQIILLGIERVGGRGRGQIGW
jgi:hypothetical protein